MSEAPTAPTTSETPAPAEAQADRLYPEAAPAAPEPAAAPTPEATEEKPPEAAAAEKPAEESAPAAIDLSLPEGFQADDATLGQFKSLAAEAGLKSEGAQKLFDLYVSEVGKLQSAQAAAFEKMTGDWQKELEALPEFSGEKGREAQTVIGRALDEYGSKEAREAFDLTGAGWNPHIVSMFYKMAQALNEGGPVGQGRPAPGRPTTAAERLYPSTQS